MRCLCPALALLLSLLPAAAAQEVVLFSFEGPGGDTEGWTPDANSAEVRTVTTKPIGMGQTIGAFEGEWMLDAGTDGLNPLPLSNAWRAITRVFPSPLDLSSAPLLSMAASGYGFGFNSRRHEFRLTVSGAGQSVRQTYVGFKDDPGETFVNAWQVLSLDLSGFAGVAAIEEIRVEYRNNDDGTAGTPSPSPWGGRFQLDAVFASASGLSGEAETSEAVFSASIRPNPAASYAHLTFSSGEGGRVRAVLYDVLGRAVHVVHDAAVLPATSHVIPIDAGSLPPGLYICRIASEQGIDLAKLFVAR